MSPNFIKTFLKKKDGKWDQNKLLFMSSLNDVYLTFCDTLIKSEAIVIWNAIDRGLY